MKELLLILGILAILLVLLLILWIAARHYFGRGGPIYDIDRILRKQPAYLERIQRGRAFLADRTSETLTITSDDGLKLFGKLYAPDTPSNRYILCMHGFRSSLGDFDCAVEFFLSQGYHVLLVHQRAHGLSEGHWITFGLKERYDCRAWCRALAERAGKDGVIVLDGLSMGATTVLMATALDLPHQVHGVIADCGFSSPWEIVCRVARSRGIPVRPIMPLMRQALRLFAGFDLKETTTVEAVQKAKVPILFCHGKDDDFVPHEMSVKTYEACASEATLVLVEGAGHGLSYIVDEPRCQAACATLLRKAAEEIR